MSLGNTVISCLTDFFNTYILCSPARRKRAATISAFDDIRVIVDFEDVDLEQTGNEFNFTFYIEVTLSGDEFVVQETLELLVFQVIHFAFVKI